jgi:hypothetical protein
MQCFPSNAAAKRALNREVKSAHLNRKGAEPERISSAVFHRTSVWFLELCACMVAVSSGLELGAA